MINFGWFMEDHRATAKRRTYGELWWWSMVSYGCWQWDGNVLVEVFWQRYSSRSTPSYSNREIPGETLVETLLELSYWQMSARASSRYHPMKLVELIKYEILRQWCSHTNQTPETTGIHRWSDARIYQFEWQSIIARSGRSKTTRLTLRLHYRIELAQ